MNHMSANDRAALYRSIRDANLANHVSRADIREDDFVLEAMFPLEYVEIIEEILQGIRDQIEDAFGLVPDSDTDCDDKVKFCLEAIKATRHDCEFRSELYKLRAAMEDLKHAQAMSGHQPA